MRARWPPSVWLDAVIKISPGRFSQQMTVELLNTRDASHIFSPVFWKALIG